MKELNVRNNAVFILRALTTKYVVLTARASFFVTCTWPHNAAWPVEGVRRVPTTGDCMRCIGQCGARSSLIHITPVAGSFLYFISLNAFCFMFFHILTPLK